MKAFHKEKQLDHSFLQKIFTPDTIAKLKALLLLREGQSVQLLQKSQKKFQEKVNFTHVIPYFLRYKIGFPLF